jgi:hypothetical protein
MDPNAAKASSKEVSIGKGRVLWVRQNPVALTLGLKPAEQFVEVVKRILTSVGVKWAEANHLLLRRGPYVIAAGLDESINGDPLVLKGQFINLFDPELQLHPEIEVAPGSRYFLVDVNRVTSSRPTVLASACKMFPAESGSDTQSFTTQGMEATPAVVLLSVPEGMPGSITLDGHNLNHDQYSSSGHLLWLHFTNSSAPQTLRLSF